MNKLLAELSQLRGSADKEEWTIEEWMVLAHVFFDTVSGTFEILKGMGNQ